MTSLIQPNDTIYIWAILVCVVFFVNWLDQKYRSVNKLGTIILYIVAGVVLANARILPFSSPVYKSLSGILVPLAIPMLLFKSDIRKIYRESGKVFLAFNLTLIASVVAAFIYAPVLRGWGLPEIPGFAAMYAAGAIGGTVNIIAMAGVFNVSENLVSATTMLANFTLGIVLFVLAFVASSKTYRRWFSHPHIDEREASVLADPDSAKKPFSAVFWKNKELSLLDILKTFGTAFAILAVSKLIAGFVVSMHPPFIVQQLLGSIWLVMTTLSVLGATFMPKWFSSLKFGDEFGIILMSLWFVSVGTSANLYKIGEYGAFVLFAFFVTLVCHLVVSFVLGKIFRINLEDICCCIAANIGGPSTTASLAISQGWSNIIAPAILCALYGYVVANYLGVLIGNFFM